MLKIYGSMLCPDCVRCCAELDTANVKYEYLDFADSLLHLKAFLVLRDSHPIFDAVKDGGYIGIPCIVDGEDVKLDWSCYVSQGNA